MVNSDALDLCVEAIEKAGYTGKIGIAMDVAASEFWKDDLKKYDLGTFLLSLSRHFATNDKLAFTASFNPT